MEKWLKRLMAWLMSWAGEWLVRLAGGAARPPVQVAAGFQTPKRVFAPDMRAQGMGLTIGRKLRGALFHASCSGRGP